MYFRPHSPRSLLQHVSKRSRHRLWFLLKVCSCFGIFVLVYFLLQFETWNFGFSRHEIVINLTRNYFRSAKRLFKGRQLVATGKCKIPEIDIWSPDTYTAIGKTSILDCSQHQINLTYVNGQSLIINQETIKSLGYDIDDITCCYHTIERVQQSKYKFDKEADNEYRYSDKCYPMQNVTQPRSGFVMVTCNGNFKTFAQVNYKNFHLIAQLPNTVDDNDALISNKISYWEKCISGENTGSYCKNIRENGRPPNVLLIGIDSTSRLNFHRFLPRTKKMLLSNLGAVEMEGYTKVGENTFPNFVPLMTSFSEDELRKICYSSRWLPQDKCPYIWKNFSSLNYLTAHLEDSPQMAIFNYMKTGFVNSPVDIYLRPWMRAVYKNSWTLDCIGYHRPEKVILDYLVNLATAAEEKAIPYFLTSWMTDLTHDDTSKVQHMDSVFASTLENLKNKGLLNNTVLLVMSDHGYRFGEIRVTSTGWYEDKLPALFIRLPDSLTKTHPNYLRELKRNSNQLTSPFDVHATLKDILNLVSAGNKENAKFSHSHKPKVLSPSQNAPNSQVQKQGTSTLRGISLLRKLPSRTCKEAGIPSQFCACNPPLGYNSSNVTTILQGAEKLVRHINHALPKVCETLILDTITAAATLSEPDGTYSSLSQRKPATIDYIISFITTPGDFRFEGYLSFDPLRNRFTRISHILRTNKVTRSTSCLDHLIGEAVGMEVFCYCKGFQYGW